MTGIQHYIEKHFGVLLLVACVLGLVVPGMDQLPNRSAIVVLAALMFVSCYRLHEGGFRTLRWRDILLFYAARYVLLPAPMWLAAHLLTPAYATGVFLLSVLPAGVSSPAIASIYGGAVAPGFALVILTQLATPFLIPLQFAWMGHFDTATAGAVMPSPLDLFVTMVWCIFVPMLLYVLVRGHRRSAAYIYRQNKFFSMLLIAFVIALVIAKQRDVILAFDSSLLASLLICLLCFGIYIVFGWWVARSAAHEERITFAACSTFNNAALGVSLALLHFAPPVILFVAVSEIAWSLLPILFRAFLNTRRA